MTEYIPVSNCIQIQIGFIDFSYWNTRKIYCQKNWVFSSDCFPVLKNFVFWCQNEVKYKNTNNWLREVLFSKCNPYIPVVRYQLALHILSVIFHYCQFLNQLSPLWIKSKAYYLFASKEILLSTLKDAVVL